MWSFWQVVAAVFSAFGVPAVLYLVKYRWDKRRWSVFRQELKRIAREPFVPETREDLRALVAVKLSDAGYEPERVASLMPMAVEYAAGIISYELRGKYAVDFEGDDDIADE